MLPEQYQCIKPHRGVHKAKPSLPRARVVGAQLAGLAAPEVALSRGAEDRAAPWHALDAPLIWQGSEQEACRPGVPPATLPPPWKVMLLSDGSVTRHLQLLTGKAVTVDCLQMQLLGEGDEGMALPPGTECIPGPLLQRQVLLRTADAPRVPFVYAASWWNAASVGTYLRDTSQPIWANLSAEHVELYREVQQVYYGHSAALEVLLESEGPFWGRHYTFWHRQQPLTLIFEVFSSRLQDYLGPLPDRQVAGASGVGARSPLRGDEG